jgi:hypothetical protein
MLWRINLVNREVHQHQTSVRSGTLSLQPIRRKYLQTNQAIGKRSCDEPSHHKSEVVRVVRWNRDHAQGM